MGVDCLVGLQYGSESKGAWAGRLANFYQASVRVGAPNAGHTVIEGGRSYKMRQIPCAWVNPDCKLFVGAGGMIALDVLGEELSMLPSEVANRLFIDKNATVLQPADREREESEKFNAFNGSTAEGVGQAMARKVLRKNGTIAQQEPDLQRFICDTKRELWDIVDGGGDVLIEGTQGYGLSVSHGPYPFVTSRDVLASSLLSDVGFAPKAVGRVFGVLRTYPIRVAGNSGPMGAKELTWAEVARRAGYSALEERTTVTKRVRRVSEIDWELLREACAANQPDGLFVGFIDYVDAKLRGVNSYEVLSGHSGAMEFLQKVERELKVPVIAVSSGPRPGEVVYMPKWLELFPEYPKHEEVV